MTQVVVFEGEKIKFRIEMLQGSLLVTSIVLLHINNLPKDQHSAERFFAEDNVVNAIDKLTKWGKNIKICHSITVTKTEKGNQAGLHTPWAQSGA